MRAQIRFVLMAAAAVFVAACNSSPAQTGENTVGGANVVSSALAPMATATTSVSLDWGSKGQAGQIAIADVLTYSGAKPAITAPTGWQLIRDDSSKTTRQSLYWHAIQANEPSASAWTFSEPVDTQGAIVLLDSVAAGGPVDMSSGNTGAGGTVTASSIVTTTSADLILSFYGTDFHLAGLAPQLPADTTAIVNQQATPHEFWILAAYQSQNGATEDQVCSAPQIFNWVAAQVAIKNASR